MAGKSVHSDEFKRKAVAALRNRGNRSADEIARGLGVSTAVIYFWRKEFGENAGVDPRARPQTGSEKHTEDFKLRAVHALRNRGSRSTHEVADELGVPRSAIYKWMHDFGYSNQRGQRPREAIEAEHAEYSPRSEGSELERLREQRARLSIEAAALRKTIVLLGSSKTR